MLDSKYQIPALGVMLYVLIEEYGVRYSLAEANPRILAADTSHPHRTEFSLDTNHLTWLSELQS